MKNKVVEQGKIILAREGLDAEGWKVVIDERPRMRGGQCRTKKKEIGISAWVVDNNDWPQVYEILVHEIAHGLCPGHRHDKIWKQTCIRLGGSGERCWQDSDNLKGSKPSKKKEPKYSATCSNCKTVHFKHRLRRRATYFCKCNGAELSWNSR